MPPASPVYFFDASALLKRYHAEPGTDVIDAAFEDDEVIRIVSDIGLIELYSAFARRVRMQEITPQDFQDAKTKITEDTGEDGVLQVEEVGRADKAEAARLIEQYSLTQNLRTLDALHLATMKRVGIERNVQTVYCADRTLCALLEAEGFTVVNPHPQR